MQFQSHVRFIESSPLLKLMVMLFGVASVMDVHGGEIAAWTATTRWPPASFTECLVTSGGFRGVHAGRGQRRGEPAGDDGDRGRRRRGDQLRGVPGGLHGQRRAEDDAVRAHVPPIVGMHRPPPRRRPWALRHGPPLPRTTTPRPGVWRCRHSDQQSQENGDHGGCML